MTDHSTPSALLEELRAGHAQNYGWALNCCAWQRDLAEDLLQEAYLRVLDGRARFRGESAARTWFFAVIRTVSMEMQRSRNRWAILALRPGWGGQAGRETAVADGPDTPDQLAELDQSCEELRRALLQLPARQREVLHLVFYADCTLEESAQTLRISLGSVRTHYHRGKRRLAELLQWEERNEQ